MTENEQGQQLVVVGVDGSPESIAALRWARHYAEATGAPVQAVRAWHYPSAFGPAPVGRAPEQINEEVEERLLAELAAAIAQVYPDSSAARAQAKVTYGHPAEALIGESQDASLLVVGYRGHGAFTGMLVGSVSIHCVTNASCPVVVVRGS
jgi:nucleotide-binding universal stress UspA family protein